MRWFEVLKEDKDRTAVFCFGRYNPPTQGHEKLMDAVDKATKQYGADSFVFVSQSHDTKRNPLKFETKLKFLKSFFPKANFTTDSYKSNAGTMAEVRNVFDALYYLADKGYDHVIMVAGSDRMPQYQKMADKYIPAQNPDVDPSKAVNIQTFTVVSAGDRDPDGDNASGASATMAREFAQNGDERSFIEKVAPNGSEELQKRLFKAVQRGMK